MRMRMVEFSSRSGALSVSGRRDGHRRLGAVRHARILHYPLIPWYELHRCRPHVSCITTQTRINLWMNFHEIFGRGWLGTRNSRLDAWVIWSGFRYGSRIFVFIRFFVIVIWNSASLRSAMMPSAQWSDFNFSISISVYSCETQTQLSKRNGT